MRVAKLIFTSGAESDLKESLLWYEAQKSGLGSRFVDEIDSLASRIRKNPDHFPEVLQNIHKANLKRFPYSVFFVLSTGDIYVIAILHNSRNPQIWKDRIK